MSETITIGIPVYNAGRHLDLAIKSVFAQTYRDWKLLLVDDGSTDGSLERIRAISDPRVTVLSDGMNRKLNFRLNEIARLTDTRFLFRMDADDVMHPERVETTLRELRQHDAATVVGSYAWTLDNHNFVHGIRRPRLPGPHPFSARHAFIHPTVAAATAWFQQNPYSEDFNFHRAQDAELWVRTVRRSHFINIPKPLLFYREVGDFRMSNYIATQFGLTMLLWRLHSEKVPTIFWTTREFLKFYVIQILARTKFINILIHARSGRTGFSDNKRAEEILREVNRTRIPWSGVS